MHMFIGMLLALQFLPAAHSPRAITFVTEKTATEATKQLMVYIRRQWLFNAIFRVEDWSVYKQTIRTNNDVGGFNRLVQLLLNEAKLVRIVVETGDLARHSTSIAIRHETALQALWEGYSEGTLKTSEFLKKEGDIYSVKFCEVNEGKIDFLQLVSRQ